MTVYVCYFDWDYEGCSEPQVVFTNEQDAERWVSDNDPRRACYVTLLAE